MLWDMIAHLSKETEAKIKALGGLKGIAISHVRLGELTTLSLSA